jgi:hypothetical protein
VDELEVDAEHFEVLKALRDWEDDGTIPARGGSLQELAERMELARGIDRRPG